jgi:hypothetical protein
MECQYMMRNIAIGLAAATIAMGCLAPSAAALQGQKKSSKGSVSGAIKMPRTYEEGRLTPREREYVREINRERLAEFTPREREHLRGIIRQRWAELTPHERKRLKGAMMRESYEELSRLDRERYRHGPYGLR